MKKSLLIIGMLVLVIFVSACTTKLGPRIELSTNSFNLGYIDPDEGIRTETFYIRNTGDSILTISSISTSCGCTEAKVKSNEILPGEQTELIVNYDPSVHPHLVGKIKRVIYIKSNDPSNEEVELELVGKSLFSSKDEYPIEEVNAERANIQEDYSKSSASISFDKTEHDFGNITQFGGIVNTTFQVINIGSFDLEITSVTTSCGCTIAKLIDSVIPPGESSTLTIFFDPNFNEEPEGRFSRTVFLRTNDPSKPKAELKIWMNILEGQ